MIVDGCYWIDMTLNFFTAYKKGGYKVGTMLLLPLLIINFADRNAHCGCAVTQRSKIVRKYLKTWFPIDFVATFPWTFFLEGHISFQNLQMVRMIRVFRCARTGRILDRMTSSWALRSELVHAFKFLIYVSVVAHVLACAFFIWPGLFHDGSCVGGVAECTAEEKTGSVPGSWIEHYELEAMDNDMQRYVMALYWSMTTMTTIGYGDVSPQLHEEKIFVICAEVIGMAFFAMLVHEINEVKKVARLNTASTKATKDQVMHIMHMNHIAKPIRDQVLEFLNFQAVTWKAHSFDPTDKQFKMLSKPLQETLLYAIYAPVLSKLPLFLDVTDTEQKLTSQAPGAY